MALQYLRKATLWYACFVFGRNTPFTLEMVDLSEKRMSLLEMMKTVRKKTEEVLPQVSFGLRRVGQLLVQESRVLNRSIDAVLVAVFSRKENVCFKWEQAS